MFSIKIRQQKRPGERWQQIVNTQFDLAKPVQLANAEASESDLLSFQIAAPTDSAAAVRIRVGSVLVASSIPADRVLSIDYDDTGDEEFPPLVCKGKILADWVGLTELIVEIKVGDSPIWVKALVLPVAVTAGKLKIEEFNQLFAELERDSAAVLLDVHGKTQVGIKSGGSLASFAPIAVLSRVHATVHELTEVLHQMARHPAFRLHIQRSREHALVGQAITDSTLAEACYDPSLLGRHGPRVVFREHLRERSRPDYRIPEHQRIADFSEYIKVQLADLRYRIDIEIADRQDRKRWRNFMKEPNQPTWWEAEDLPRIDELQRCRQKIVQLRGVVEDWRKFTFLPPGQCLRQKPQSTPLFRDNAVYRRAFRLIAGHFLTYQASLDTHQLLIQARSLPILYEWWCAVQVIRILAKGLTPLIHDPLVSSIISTRLAQEGRRFTIEFASDQAINFTDKYGSRVRFRYQPVYTASQERNGPAVAVLDSGSIRIPDITLEIYPARSSVGDIPELIVVFDAKYSSATQWEKMTEVSIKYSKIGDVKTGRVLSRQIWALTVAPPASFTPSDSLRNYCTVDNEAFWSAQFDVGNPVNGAVQTRPVNPGSFDPLKELILLLLKRANVDYAESLNATQD